MSILQSNPGSSSIAGNRRVVALEALEDRRLLAVVNLTDQEQLLLELVNRARQNPAAEVALYGVGLNDGLPTGTIVSSPKQPLAPHQALVNAARGHSQDMLDQDFFEHTNPYNDKDCVARANDAGYTGWQNLAENISWGGSTGVIDENAHVYQRHESLIRSPGHRINVMGEVYRELGSGVRYGRFTSEGNEYNASMATELFGNRSGDHFITGVVYSDAVEDDDFYSIGESLANVTLRAVNKSSGQTFTEISGPSGGFALQVPDGTYTVTASGGSLPVPVTVIDVSINRSNVKVDITPSPNIAPTAEDDLASLTVNTTITIDATDNDVDTDGTIDVTTVRIASNPEHGNATVDLATGRISYTPSTNYVGPDAFEYTVRDDRETLSNVAQVTIYVNPAQTSAYTNLALYVDINGDLLCTPLDVLTLIHDINTNGPRALPAGGTTPPFVDVSGDNHATPLDVLQVIAFLNWHGVGGEGEADSEGEAEGGSTAWPVEMLAHFTVPANGVSWLTLDAAIQGGPPSPIRLVPIVAAVVQGPIPVTNDGINKWDTNSVAKQGQECAEIVFSREVALDWFLDSLVG